MIPHFDHSKASELDLKKLLPESDRSAFVAEPLSLEYDKKFCRRIMSLEDKLLGELHKLSTSEAVMQIRDFRNMLNQAYIRFSELGYISSSTICDASDYYWACKEKAFSGEFNYVLPSIK
jgi:hypothetical protein